MPRFLVPHKYGPHRVAAISLYRNLITSLSNSPIPPDHRTSLNSLIRFRFRRNRLNTSHRLLGPLFEHGYAILDTLDLTRSSSPAGQAGAKNLLARYLAEKRNKTLLERIAWEQGDEFKRQQEEARKRKEREAPSFTRDPTQGAGWKARPLPLAKLKAQARPSPTNPTSSESHTGTTEQDPRPQRHIPILFSANKIPVLRFTKPQPRSLSLFLQSRITQRQRRNDRALALSHLLSTAEGEDLWDDILFRLHGIGPHEAMAEPRDPSGQPGEPIIDVYGATWAAPVRAALEGVYDLLAEEKEKNARRASEYVALIDREKAARDEERRERVRERNRRAWGRKVGRWKEEGVFEEGKKRAAGGDKQVASDEKGKGMGRVRWRASGGDRWGG
ncbi:hypothetical protein BDZ85DRAFT_121738 [Elsinoe ampelina]|uniref:Uncharacterized protein n=1 Tax=Elsinoe ampelina TaxID=302913 RepID=A0A6A6GC06_9PEZI|nr:hypothetical protein BDZ85DRAFT_121738 [Elsinoe ampelina]